MSRIHVSHREITRFARERVNLPLKRARQYQAQVQRLGDTLGNSLDEHSKFSLREMLLFGSVAKGTALRRSCDIDVACYFGGPETPADVRSLQDFIAGCLRCAFPRISSDQVKVQNYSLTFSSKRPGLNVDIIPILYAGDALCHGNLLSRKDGPILQTNIPLQLEFARSRSRAQKSHFTQVVQLAKYWALQTTLKGDGFRPGSYLVELILAKLSDDGLDFSDYPEALQEFFRYIARTNLREPIVFSDYYHPSTAGDPCDGAQVIDPVNSGHNVARRLSPESLHDIAIAAGEAGEIIDDALRAPTRHLSIACWRQLFGSGFQA